MKTLEKEFVQNSDKRGDNTFRQVKRNEYAAIYQRFTMDGKPREFEVFQIKVAGGTEIFGRYYDKYEAYPGTSAFGRTAWSTNSRERAEQIFNEITKGKGKRWADSTARAVKVKVQIVKNPKGRRGGRKRMVRPAVILPKKKFCMKDLLSANPAGWTQPSLYIELMQLKKASRVEEVERVSGGRGRAVVFYQSRA
jgi:hypothetical protein